jgi:hypothetical protein
MERLGACWSLLLCCCFGTPAAHSGSPKSDVSKSEAIVSCAHPPSGSMTAALICSDMSEAMGQLDEAGCFVVDSPAVVEVRKVWVARESLPANAAAHDRTIQLFMAGCLVEAHSKTKPPDPTEISAVAYLRNALADPDPQIAGVAMMALGPVLTEQDIDTIVRLASTQSALVMPAVTALSLPCTVETASGMRAAWSFPAKCYCPRPHRELTSGDEAT